VIRRRRGASPRRQEQRGDQRTGDRDGRGDRRPATSEITSVNPPETWSLRGIDGPIRAVVNVTVEGLEATRSRVTIDLDFEGHGIGKLLVPLVVRRDAQKEMPENLGRLKDRLESRA
jgi:hypothetical protein